MPKNPHANFRPTLESYSGQGAFRFWCQMALPLTYDDSLSYYELLNKVVTYLNNTIEDVGKVEDNVAALNEAYGKLEDYVNTYFDEIDIEAELKNVLDAMAEDGSLDSLLDPLVAARLGDVVAEQINAVVANQIGDVVGEQIGGAVIENLPAVVPDAVSDWLDENVTPTTPIVDSTLTISGAAADAKVTGKEITDLKNALSLKVYTLTSDNWKNKSYSSTSGAPSDSTTRISTEDYISELIVSITPISGYEVSIYAWDDSNAFQGCWNGSTWAVGSQIWIANSVDVTKLTGNYNLRVILRKADNSTIETIECTNVIFESVIGEEFTNLKSSLIKYNSYNLLVPYPKGSSASSGITWRWDGETCYYSGASTSPTINRLYYNTTRFPEGMEPGKTYIIDYKSTDNKVAFNCVYYKNGTSLSSSPYYYNSGLLTIPSDAEGIHIRLYIAGNVTADGSISVKLLNSPTNANLAEQIKNNNRRIAVDKIGAMINVAETYFNEAYKPGNHFVYQQQHSTGLFYDFPYYIYDGEQWGDNQEYEGVPCTQCAEFICTLIKGIRYENSRYVSGENGINQFAQWAWFSDDKYIIDYQTQGTRDDYMDSKAMADYANKHDFLYPMNIDKPNIAVGDVVFWNTSNPGPLTSIANINHCAMILQVGMDTKTIEIVESWSTTKPNGEGLGIRIRTINISDIAYYATFPLKDTAHVYEIIYKLPYTITSEANSRNDNVLFRNDLSKFGVLDKGFYTFIVAGEFDENSMPYINYQVRGSNLFAGALNFVKSANTYICSVYVSEDIANNNIFIGYDKTKSCVMNKLIVVKGYINIDSDFEI